MRTPAIKWTKTANCYRDQTCRIEIWKRVEGHQIYMNNEPTNCTFRTLEVAQWVARNLRDKNAATFLA